MRIAWLIFVFPCFGALADPVSAKITRELVRGSQSTLLLDCSDDECWVRRTDSGGERGRWKFSPIKARREIGRFLASVREVPTDSFAKRPRAGGSIEWVVVLGDKKNSGTLIHQTSLKPRSQRAQAQRLALLNLEAALSAVGQP